MLAEHVDAGECPCHGNPCPSNGAHLRDQQEVGTCLQPAADRIGASNKPTREADAGNQGHTILVLKTGLLLLLSLIWGRSFTLIKTAVETLPTLTMTAARVTIAALLIVPFAKMHGLSLPWGVYYGAL
jgi:hypothetical protein